MNYKLFFFLILLASCGQKPENQNSYLSDVGKILPDMLLLDYPNFKPCHDDWVLFYYQTDDAHLYKGEKPAILAAFKDLDLPKISQNSGYITIRFLVNCKGETGRFRTEQLDFDYKLKIFEGDIVLKILSKTKALDGWLPSTANGYKCDYYNYLTFKIIDNQIAEILP
jgi:hypothetical protein